MPATSVLTTNLDTTRAGEVLPWRLATGAFSFAAAMLGVLVCALPARAEPAHHPKGAYSLFAYCPFKDPELAFCQASVTTGGELRIGRMVVPITRAFVGVRGAWNGPPEQIEHLTYAPPEEGGTSQPVPLPVPGGLAAVIEPASLPASLQAAFDALVSTGLGTLTATMEVAGPPSSVDVHFANSETEEGVVVEEPLRIKLTSPFLGENCYIGSVSDPIKIETTEETTKPPPPNKPIKGAFGAVTFVEEEIVAIVGNSAVDNTFAVPVASGCGGSLAPLVDRAIDAKLGLPSPVGRNAEVIDSTLTITAPANVLASE